MATASGAFSRRPVRFTSETIREFGTYQDTPRDFHRDYRGQIASAIVTAYTAHRIRAGSELHKTALNVYQALESSEPMLVAMRIHLGLDPDGQEDNRIKESLNAVAAVVADVKRLIQWIG